MRLSSLHIAVILIFTWFCLIGKNEAAIGGNCTNNNDCGNGEICTTETCGCNTGGGYENIGGVCKASPITVSVTGSNSSVAYGSDTDLTATIKTSVNVTAVTWQKVPSSGDPVNLANSTKYTQTGDPGSGTVVLTISNLNYSDEASYQVQVTNSLGTTNTSNQVEVKVARVLPSVTLSSPTQSGTTVTVGCNATVTADSPPISAIKWKKNETFIDIINSNGKYSGGTVSSPALIINNITTSDRGDYRCEATSPAGSKTSDDKVTLTPPSNVNITGDSTVLHGASVTYRGSYTSVLQTVTIKWQKIGNDNKFKDIVISSPDGKYTGSNNAGPNPKLVINSVNFSDRTSYRMVVSNGVGSTNSPNVTFTVTGGELTVTAGPDVSGRFGRSVTVKCNVTGPEVNNILWKKISGSNSPKDIDIDTSNGKYTGGTVSSPSLIINSLVINDGGEYQCIARNPKYTSNDEASVTVKYGQFNKDCTEAERCDVSKSLTCNNGKCLCISTHYHKNEVCYQKSSLAPPINHINSTSTSQFSVFWSQPTTNYDLVTGYIVSWKVSGGSSPALNQSMDRITTSFTVSSGLVSGQLYSVTVTSVVELTNPTGTIHVPSQERKVRLDPLPPGSILRSESSFARNNLTLKWTPPTNTSVTKYEVKIDNTVQFTVNDNPSLQFTKKELTPGKYYDVSIVTISGTSSEPTGEKRSTTYTETIRIIPTRPDPPTNVACPQQPKDISLEISWTPPTKPNGHIVMYQIIVDPGIRTIDTPNNDTNYNVVGLSPEVTYNFTVRTINDAVETQKVSDPSETINCSTKAGVSTPPTNLSINKVGSRGFQITFAKPDNVSGQLAAYKILIMEGSTCVQQIIIARNCPQCVSTNGCPEALTVTKPDINQPVKHQATDLKPYTNYIVKVAAVNGDGEGRFDNTTVKTDEETPQKPEQITVMNIEAKTLTLSWKVADPSPGNTTYTIDVYEGTDDTGSNFTLRTPKLYTYGFNKQSVSIDKLEEYWPYKFKVDAATIKGNTTSDLSNVFRTKQAAPGQVENFDVKMKDGDYRMAYVYWSIPSLRNRNGVLQSYHFTNNHTGMEKTETIPVSFSSPDIERNFTVVPEEVYSVEVYVRNNENMHSKPVTKIYPAPAGPPPIDNNIELITTAPGEHKPSERTITVEVNVDFFKDDLNGKQVFFGIAVCEKSKCESTSLGTSTKTNEWEGLPNWHKARESGFPLYRVTNGTYMEDIRSGASRRKRSTSSDFTIGIDTTCPSMDSSVYCNGPLNPGQSYKVFIFACTNGGCTQSKANGPYYTIVVKIEEPTNLGLIVGTIVGLVAVLGIVVLVLVFLKRRNRLGKPSKYTEKIETVADIEDPVPKNIPRKRPIQLKELADKVAEKHKDSNLYFAREYEDLKALSAKHPTETSETDSNKLKNRYVNILPFDQTRVKLQLTEDDDPSTDFINANYLPGHKSEREYIATQGPIPGTIDDFWRMIWEQNVSIIVMLTLCKEEGRVKCEMYWPENVKEPKQYGDLVVETVSCSTVNFYDFRIFKIKLGDTTRTLKHFHFLQWKDFSANVQNDVMIDFIKNVRNHIRPPDMNGPVVVHCSAGVGRTGTYCALDHLFQVIDEHDLEHSIDIFDLVLNLREHRMFMVQTEQQYVFIHDCVRDYVERKKKEMQGDLLYENVNRAFVADDPAEESLYQNYSNQRTDL